MRIIILVVLKSSLSQIGRFAICPNETVLFECFVMGPTLEWILSDEYSAVYNQSNNNKTDVVTTLGPALVWLSNSKQLQLSSQLVLPYSPDINDVTIQCKTTDPMESQKLHYTLSGNNTNYL